MKYLSAQANTQTNTKRSTKKYLFSAVFILAMLALWFLFTAKSVVITTIPKIEKVAISGGVYINWQEHLLMRSGQYQIQAQLTGHYPLNQSFIVDQQQNQQMNFNFIRLPGELELAFEANNIAAENLKVVVDGQAIELKNNIISNIAAGEHQVMLISDNYLPYSSQVNIEGREQSQLLNVALQPAWAKLSVNSTPEGASIYQGDKLLGITPLTTNLLQGEQDLRFEKDNYRSTNRVISIKAGNDQTVATVKLFKRMGRLSISTIPSQVSVTYGNKYLGKTPLNIDVLPDVKQKLLLVKEGYQAISSSVLVPSSQTFHKNFTLAEVVGDIVINATPKDALLYVDGRLMGRAKQKLTLAVKQQKINIEKAGYLSYQTTILPNESMEQVLNVELKTLEQAKWQNMKPIITTSVGAKLKLFKPKDTFVMGASRREQGRRANEVKRTVQLSKAFYLAFTETTNKEFRQFQREHSSGHVKGNSLNGLTQPAVKLTWLQAAMFCNWLSIKEKLAQVYQIESGELVSFDQQANGYRLPTEAEWVWAARYQEGKMLKYPWGETLPPKSGAGNFADISGAPILGQVLTSYNDRYIVSAPVTSFTKNEKGLFDISGNVAEWLHDFYHIKTGLSLKTEQDPMGPTSGEYHVIRGASWAHGGRTELRLSFRDYGNEMRNDLGFRIARNAQ